MCYNSISTENWTKLFVNNALCLTFSYQLLWVGINFHKFVDSSWILWVKIYHPFKELETTYLQVFCMQLICYLGNEIVILHWKFKKVTSTFQVASISVCKQNHFKANTCHTYMTYGQPWHMDNQDNLGGNEDACPW